MVTSTSIKSVKHELGADDESHPDINEAQIFLPASKNATASIRARSDVVDAPVPSLARSKTIVDNQVQVIDLDALPSPQVKRAKSIKHEPIDHDEPPAKRMKTESNVDPNRGDSVESEALRLKKEKARRLKERIERAKQLAKLEEESYALDEEIMAEERALKDKA